MLFYCLVNTVPAAAMGNALCDKCGGMLLFLGYQRTFDGTAILPFGTSIWGQQVTIVHSDLSEPQNLEYY